MNNHLSLLLLVAISLASPVFALVKQTADGLVIDSNVEFNEVRSGMTALEVTIGGQAMSNVLERQPDYYPAYFFNKASDLATTETSFTLIPGLHAPVFVESASAAAVVTVAVPVTTNTFLSSKETLDYELRLDGNSIASTKSNSKMSVIRSNTFTTIVPLRHGDHVFDVAWKSATLISTGDFNMTRSIAILIVPVAPGVQVRNDEDQTMAYEDMIVNYFDELSPALRIREDSVMVAAIQGYLESTLSTCFYRMTLNGNDAQLLSSHDEVQIGNIGPVNHIELANVDVATPSSRAQFGTPGSKAVSSTGVFSNIQQSFLVIPKRYGVETALFSQYSPYVEAGVNATNLLDESTFTLSKNSVVQITAQCTISSTSVVDAASVEINLMVNGVVVTTTHGYSASTNVEMSIVFTWTGELGAGPHTLAVEFKKLFGDSIICNRGGNFAPTTVHIVALPDAF